MNNFLAQLTKYIGFGISAPIILEQQDGCWNHFYLSCLPCTNLDVLVYNLRNHLSRYEYYTPLKTEEDQVIYQHKLLPPFRVTESRDPYLKCFTLDMLVA